MICNLVLVRNDYDRLALSIQFLEQRHDFFGGERVQVASRLVAQDQNGIVDNLESVIFSAEISGPINAGATIPFTNQFPVPRFAAIL